MTRKEVPALSFSQAITGLLDAAVWDDDQWCSILGFSADVIPRIRRGEYMPRDEDMTAIIDHLRRISGSEAAPDVPEALRQFWHTCHVWERAGEVVGKMASGLVLECREHEPRYARITRWTNAFTMESLEAGIGAVLPEHRPDFFEDLTRLLAKHREPGL